MRVLHLQVRGTTSDQLSFDVHASLKINSCLACADQEGGQGVQNPLKNGINILAILAGIL